jgi:hypothetical protein
MLVKMCECGHDDSKHEWCGNPPEEEQRKWDVSSKMNWKYEDNVYPYRPVKLPCLCFVCSDGFEGCDGFKEVLK